MNFFFYLLTFLYVSKRNEHTCVEEIERLEWGMFLFKSATVAKVFVESLLNSSQDFSNETKNVRFLHMSTHCFGQFLLA